MPLQYRPIRTDLSTQNILKIQARFADRVGIVADVSTRIAEYGLSIVLMEVVRRVNEAIVYLEIEDGRQPIEKGKVLDIFKHLKGFSGVRIIDILPQEERCNRFSVVLDNISDGVLSIDGSGKLTTINRVAALVLGVDPEEVVGKNITILNLPQYPILESLNGKKLDNVKQNLITARRRYQYISTCKPIRDAHGRVVGAVEISRDMQEIKKMACSFAEGGPICFTDIIGRNSAIQQAIALAERIAKTDASVAIYGASGTGKELFARAIHTASNRPGLFVPINCAALPENLLESELFGYVGGAFTGGMKNGKAGLFEVAKKGTVFLDEIADLPLPSQAKLLRLIQEKAVRRIGGTEEIPIDVRILTASNKWLEKLVEEKLFRKDLYYRISVLPIHIPPLKERLDDIEILVDHFLFTLINKLEKQVCPRLSPAAVQKLKGHDWPGNVRELKNVIERSVILNTTDSIDVNNILFSHELSQCARNTVPIDLAGKSSLRAMVAGFEKNTILSILAKEKTVRKTALALNMSHPGLLKKMKKYGIPTS